MVAATVGGWVDALSSETTKKEEAIGTTTGMSTLPRPR